jgi:hypothetical protein
MYNMVPLQIYANNNQILNTGDILILRAQGIEKNEQFLVGMRFLLKVMKM